MIKVYRDNVEVCEVSSKNASHKTAIMGIDEVQVSVVVDEVLDIKEGDYIQIDGVHYSLNRDADFTKVSDVQFGYDLVFEHPKYTLLDKLVAHKVSGIKTFPLMGKLADFVSLIVWNVNKTPDNPLGVDTGWSVGSVIDTEYKNIVFDADNGQTALVKLANAFDCEFYFVNKQINFVTRIEHLTDLIFEQGKEKGLYEITQENLDKEDTVTRLYVRGGNQNVPNSAADESGYLKLPEDYLENFSEHKKVVEKYVVFEDIHPTFVGAIASVSGEDNIEIVCPQIDFDLNEIAVGSDARINFLTGDLMGVDFEFQYYHLEKKITLIAKEDETALVDDDGNKSLIPGSIKKARVGDKFNFTGVLLPQSYVDNAITKLRYKGNEYLGFYSRKRVRFGLNIDHRFMRDDDLSVGDLVTINLPEKGIENLLIRITSLDKNLHTGKISATVSNYLDEKWESKIESQLSSIKTSIKAGGGGGGVVDLIIDIIEQFDGRELTDKNILSSLRVIKEISDRALSKIQDDITPYHIGVGSLTSEGKITAKDGMQIGESYIPGLTGLGGLITKEARAYLKSLSLTEFLEVPELRYNRVEIVMGDLWRAPGAGILEDVDEINQIITLKLEDGDIGTFRYDDICMGIYHSMDKTENATEDSDDGMGNSEFAGFATSYFRVTQVIDGDRYSKFRYELKPGTHIHPKKFMHCTVRGNFSNVERQTSMYQTRTYTRYLKNVNTWNFGLNNIAMQTGDLSNLSIFGLDMTGYSAYLENVYFSGIIHQLSAKIKEQLDAQMVGGKNLLREYDIRFGFKYWGNAGEFTEFDMNLIESTPQLQVQPNILNWTFPIRYGTVVITANGAWNITTPNWLNSYPAAGSGNKNVDLKAGEYKGRDARVGTVAIKSGVIERNVSVSQAGLAEFVTIDPILNVGYEAQTVTITGKSNSSKLTFTTDTGYLEINLPAQYKVNGANVSNGSLIAGDPGALDEYSFSITVAVGENVEEFSIQNNIFATAEGGQKAISTIVQRRTRIKVLADTDNNVISIGDMIFHIN